MKKLMIVSAVLSIGFLANSAMAYVVRQWDDYGQVAQIVEPLLGDKFNVYRFQDETGSGTSTCYLSVDVQTHQQSMSCVK